MKHFVEKHLSNNFIKIRSYFWLLLLLFFGIHSPHNKIKATIESPDDGVEQVEQYKPETNDHLGVANAIRQNNADTAVIIDAIIDRSLSLICMIDVFKW